jgi:hypothetical protein
VDAMHDCIAGILMQASCLQVRLQVGGAHQCFGASHILLQHAGSRRPWAVLR